MSKLKIGIVEDEAIIADHIASVLTQLGYQVAEPAGSYAEALEMMEEEKPDLLLLDVQLRGKKDGIELAAKIREDYRIPFIFLTANADSATVDRAKKVNPASYLVKPFTKDDLYTAIEICLHNSSSVGPEATGSASKPSTPTALFIKDGQLFNKVKIADILYLESEHVYVNVHTAERKFLVRTSLQDYLVHFDPQEFLRIHRSYVVNLEHIQSVHSEYVIVNGITLPVGKSFRSDLLKRLNLG